MTIWFTADLHLGHAKVILPSYSDRPFRDVNEMDAALIERWCARVDPSDEVYVLGDFAFAGSGRSKGLLAALPGRKYLLRGNHDRDARASHGWGWIKDYHELKVDEVRVVLMHYPIHSWRGRSRGSYHLHGHSHGLESPHQRRLDVGVDLWDYRPLSWTEVTLRLAGRPVGPGHHPGEEN